MKNSSKLFNKLPTKPDELLQILGRLDIQYEIFEHEPVFTVLQAKNFRKNMDGFYIKNLFLKDKKNKFFLIVAQEDSKINLKNIPSTLGSARISFGLKEQLIGKLGVFPGAVTPLSIINNKEKDITIFLDEKIINQKKYYVIP